MSLAHEQRRSLLLTRRLLCDLMHHSTRPKRVSELRDRASRCLKHFPPLGDDGWPLFSQDVWPDSKPAPHATLNEFNVQPECNEL